MKTKVREKQKIFQVNQCVKGEQRVCKSIIINFLMVVEKLISFLFDLSVKEENEQEKEKRAQTSINFYTFDINDLSFSL